jgi:drug/metabolite transporter (DMT)-like permease
MGLPDPDVTTLCGKKRRRSVGSNGDMNGDLAGLDPLSSLGHGPTRDGRPALEEVLPDATTTSSWLAAAGPLVFGQLVAILASAMNIFSYRLNHSYHLQSQFFQLIFVYWILSFGLLFRKPRQQHAIEDSSESQEALTDVDTVEERQDVGSEMPVSLTLQQAPSLGPWVNGRQVPDTLTLPSTAAPQRSETILVSGTRPDRRKASLGGDRDALTNDRENRHFLLLGTWIPLCIPWWQYLGMSLLDVFPNVLTLWSYHYTTLTSTTLLGSSLIVPSTMIFARCLLKRRFGLYHVAGVCLCIVGGAVTVYLDVDQDTAMTATTAPLEDAPPPPPPGPHLYIGDLLAMTAAVLYALGDNIAEYAVKHIDRYEYIGMLGIFGFLQSCLLCWLLERSEVAAWWHGETTTAANGVGALNAGNNATVAADSVASMDQGYQDGLMTLVLYALSVAGYYITEAWFLVRSDATLLNLSLQASNLWVVLYMAVISSLPLPCGLYFALFSVFCGVLVYERGPAMFCCHGNVATSANHSLDEARTASASTLGDEMVQHPDGGTSNRQFSRIPTIRRYAYDSVASEPQED